MVWYVLSQSTAFFSLALTSYIIGRRLTRQVSYGSFAAELAVSTSVGLGVLASLVLGLGLVDLLYRWTVLALVAIVFLVCHRTWRDSIERCRRADWRALLKPPRLAATAVGSLLLVAAFVMALYPPTGFDATMYHLPQAATFIDSHSIAFSPELRYPVFPHLQEVLFAVVMLFWNDSAVPLVQTLSMVLVALGLYAWGTEFFSRRTGLWAAALWLGNPLVLWFGTQAYVDVGLAAFTTLAAFAFAVWTRTRQTAWLILSAALCGFGAATKYHGLFFLAALGLASLLVCIKQRRYRLAGVLWLAAFLVALPWYARIYFHTGNPLFPLFPSVFGFSEWSLTLSSMPYADSVDAIARSASSSWWNVPVLLVKAGVFKLSGQMETFLAVPWNLTFHLEKFRGPHIPFPLVYLLASPLLVLAFQRSPWVRFLLALVAVYGACWFITVPDARYLICVLGFLSLATAAAISQIWPPLRGLPRRLRVGLVVLLCTLFLLPAGLFAWPVLAWRGLLPVTEHERQVYLENVLPTSYDAITFLNQTYGDRYRVYALKSSQLTYYAKGRLLGDWFGPYRFARVRKWVKFRRYRSFDSSKFGDARGFYNELRSMDVGFLLAPRCKGALGFPVDDFFRDHFELVFSTRSPPARTDLPAVVLDQDPAGQDRQKERKAACLWKLQDATTGTPAGGLSRPL
ncbi:MAG: glycosyltransferase family 39 protein [Acidobacteria bacterium]|nr:glycosyltransferase family 39 protein [Acidobacteriota bacterium]